MARIYSLAKELGVDSKDLVDICAKAGVTGKGSALASLSNDEVERLKSYLGGGKSSEKTVKPKKDAISNTTGVPTTFTRDDYIAPGGTSGTPPSVITGPTPEAGPKRPDVSKPPVKKGPVVKLAAMPTAVEPPTQGPVEPSPQKPDLRLPLDAIRGAKVGVKAPLEQFTRHEKRKGTEKERKIADGSSKPAPAESPLGKKTDAGRRRSKDETVVEDEGTDKRLAGMASSRVSRQQHRKSRLTDANPLKDADADSPRGRRARAIRKTPSTAAPRKGSVIIQLPCTVRSFSEATGVSTSVLQSTLMRMGTMATINMQLDADTAALLAAEIDLDVDFRHEVTLEETVLTKIREAEDDPESLSERPPIVTFLGHVDHGKTTLLDQIIGTNVVDGEVGGITQHIRAYTVQKNGRRISFVDTPGHEAFTEMRARGAHVTDIAVLVIAADDGVMPQTIEAISHAKAAEVPIVVALNKIDLPGADADKAMQGLASNELLPSEWGGDVEVVKTSALTGDGIDDLLETLLLTAEIHEYKANPGRSAFGTCLEAQRESDRGVIAKLIVQNGTMAVGDIIVCGAAHGRIKAMYDTLHTDTKLSQAGPSTPVNVTGLDIAPDAGEAFYVLSDITQARQIAGQRESYSREQSLGGHTARVSFEEFQRRLEEGRLSASDKIVTLNLILRADVQGSIEAILKELEKLEHPEIRIRVLQCSVGGITVADVTLAHASQGVIVGFNVIPDEAARLMADKRGVEIRRYDIIYRVTEDIKALLEGKLAPDEQETELGRVLVKQVFSVSRLGKIAGCHVVKGVIERGCRIRVNRDGRGIGEYALDSLRREKDDVRQVREGFECGLKLAGFNDFKEGDILEAFKIDQVARTLDLV